MTSSLLQIAGALLIFAAPVFLIYQLVQWLKEWRSALRRAPHVDQAIAALQGVNADLRKRIGDLERDRDEAKFRLAKLEQALRGRK